MDSPKVSLAMLRPTKPLNKFQSNYLGNQMARGLIAAQGQSTEHRLAVGDKVEDFYMYTPAMPVGTVTEVFRENGHNRVATETGFHREQDLRRMA